MNIFTKAGQTFQETKQKVLGSDDAYVCQSCEQAVDADYDHCPHCGEATVVPVE